MMPHRLLAIDIGNTNIVVGLYEAENLKTMFRLSSERSKTSDEMELALRSHLLARSIEPEKIDAIAVASVAPALLDATCSGARALAANRVEPILIRADLDCGIQVRYANRGELGADRIANGVGALEKYGSPLIVVDFGTALTFDAVSAGAYLGGAIAPGPKIALAALFGGTAKLPAITLEKPDSIIGNDTVDSMRAGIYHGYAAMIDGICARMKLELSADRVKVIATGGEAELFASASSSIDLIDERLTLDGIRIIHARLAGADRKSR